MKIDILLILLFLFHFYKYSKCKIEIKMDKKYQSCEFTFSYGDYEEFSNAGSVFKKCEFLNPNLTVKLSNYFLPALPNGTFSNLGYLNSFTLEISDNTQIQLLSPLLPEYYVFEHMKFDSAIIDISNSASLSGWKLEALSFPNNAKMKDFEFIAVNSKLVYLPPSFGKVANGQLTVIRILNCSLRWLGTKVFAPFINLKNLELRNNFIEKFERSHLPDEARQLISIDLGKNRLRYLPADLFNDSKLSMQRIFLDGNNIKILGDQMKIILEAQSPPFPHGVLWICSCNETVKLSEKFPSRNILEHEKCFTDEYKIKKMKDFSQECERNSEN